MKDDRFEDMTVSQLVERFTSIAIAQDNALRLDEITKFNRLYDEMEAVEDALKSRNGDQRRALLPLFLHPNAQVRLKAATATLALAPEAARQTLQIISDRQEYP